MTAEKNLAGTTGHVDDVLTEINGLGKAAERDLHSVGIRSFNELAQYTPAELAKVLYEQTQNARYSVALIDNNDWIGQARSKLAGRASAEARTLPVNTAATPSTQEAHGQLEEWTLQAEFTLYFENRVSEQGDDAWQTRVWQTRVRDKECDNEEIFGGIDPSSWVDWIVGQAQLPYESSLTAVGEPEPVGQTDLSAASLEIVDVQLFEAKPSADPLGKTLTTVVSFQIRGKDAEKLTARAVSYQTNIRIINRHTDAAKLVATGYGQLQPGVYEYRDERHFPMPEAGSYQWECTVLLTPPYPIKAVHRGPLVTIKP